MSVRIPSPTPHFFRSVVHVALGNYGAIVLSALQSVVLARRLGADGFGRLALVVMVVQVLSSLVFSWSQAGLVKFGAHEYAQERSLADTFWARSAVVAPFLLVLVAGLLVEQRRAAAYLDVPVWAVWLVLGYFVLSQLLATIGSVFQALQQMNRYAATLYLDRLIVLSITLLLPARYVSGPVPIVMCYAASSLLVFGWALAVVDREALSVVRPSRAALTSLWRFSIPVLISSIVGIVGGQAIMFAVVNHFYSTADLGVYSLANQIANVFQQISVIVSLVLLPRLSIMVGRQEDTMVGTLAQRVMPYGLLGVSLALGTSALIARFAIPIVFGSAFATAVPLLMILIASAMALAIFSLFVPFFNAYGLTWTLTGLTAISAAVNMAAVVLLVPRYGPLGAAMATVLSSCALAALTLVAGQRRFGIRAWRFGLLAAPVAAVAVAGYLIEGNAAYPVGLFAMGVTTYALIAILRLFNREDLMALGRVGMPSSVGRSLAKLFHYQASEG